ncbi:uncharacterized protein [Typha latifolia]|uniref:uncharacterized protein n=1 Tax=Typha latifolia TaxID=4733 RepID=UPI003C2E822A
MGLKSLTLQMIPWYCFHLSGVACPSPDRREPVRLVGSDGRVQIYHRPISAAELMREHPRHLICRSDSFYIGQKVPPLSSRDLLQPGHSYFLLPSHFFHSVLSFVSLASSLLLVKGNGNNNNYKKAGGVLRPFEVEKSATGMLRIRVSDEFLVEEEEEEEKGGGGLRVCSTVELEKEYEELVRCRWRQWRPKLETIREKRKRGKMVVFGVFWGKERRRRRRKNGTH